MVNPRMTGGNERLGDAFHEYSESAKGKMHELGETVRDYYHDGFEKAKEMEKHLEHYVQAKPLQSILIAAGISLVTGLLIGALVRND